MRRRTRCRWGVCRDNAWGRSLAELRRGEKAVVEIVCGKRKALLYSYGIVAGSEVEVLQTFPLYVVRVGQTELGLDAAVCTDIVVSEKNEVEKS